MKKALIILTCLIPSIGFSKPLILKKSNMVSLNTEIDDLAVANVSAQISKLVADGAKEIILVLNSPGGSVSAGLELLEVIKGQGVKVHTLSVFSASMSFIISQLLDTRYVTPSSTLMSHRARISGIGGEVPGDLLVRLSYLTERLARIDAAVAKRAFLKTEVYQRMIADEMWLDGHAALSGNFADELTYAKCDESLSGTHTERISVFFIQADMTFSNCPLITGPLKVQIIGGGDASISRQLEIQKSLKNNYHFRNNATYIYRSR